MDNQYLNKWRSDMSDLDKARKRAEKIKERIEEALIDMALHYELGVPEVIFSNNNLMAANHDVTMKTQIDVSFKFKV